MRIMIATLGSHGDVHPFLGIGRELERRGHSCAIATHRFFAGDVATAGLDLLPIGDDVAIERVLKHPDLFHRLRGPAVILSALAPSFPAMTDALRRHVAYWRPDVMLVHSAALIARWVAVERRVPAALAVMGPYAWGNPLDPAPLMQFAPGSWRRRQARMAERALAPVAQAWFRGWTRSLRRRAGFPPGSSSLADEFRGGDLNLGLWSSAFRPSLPGDPPQGVITGFPWYDGTPGTALDPELDAFLACGEPPIVFTLGSAAVYSARDFYTIAARACARLGRRGVLLVGRGVAPPRELPEDVIAVAWAPHSRIFPRALATVHHGGIGTTGQALRAGRPSLVIPHAFDQFNNGVRVDALGVGTMLARHRLTEARLVVALDRITGDPAFAAGARDLGGRVAPDGAAAAATAIEGLARERGVLCPAA